MVSDAKRFLEATPEKVCRAYFDKLDGIDAKWAAIEEGVATSVVTAAVGGPVVMGTILVAGTASTAYGVYELGNFTVEKLGSWAENYCEAQSLYKRIRVKSSLSPSSLQ